MKKVGKSNTQAVLRLGDPISKTNRNITAEIWFSYLEVVDKLREKGLTFVGPIKKCKREIPLEFLPQRNKEYGSSIQGFVKEKLLLSYVPKKNRVVLLISSKLHSACFDFESGRLEIIAMYKSTKPVADTLDPKCSSYSKVAKHAAGPCRFSELCWILPE
jgi:hypothetical protein